MFDTAMRIAPGSGPRAHVACSYTGHALFASGFLPESFDEVSMFSLGSIALISLLPSAAEPTTVQSGLRVPAGFEVVEFADDKLASDIYCLTVDPRGRVIVSGKGYIRLLIDDNRLGRANRAIDFSSGPKDGAMGLFWEGTSLYVAGDGGLRRFRDENGDGRADGPSELIQKLQTGGEHSAHAIHRGPDGWLYVLCGNSTGVDRSLARSSGSPIREPVAGCVLRFSPDLKTSEIVADGFRNAYGMDFNPDGELFTFDSDNERCVALPWYEGCRLYHVQEGGHYGWLGPQLAPWWRLPPYSCDVVGPVAALGRGSPTGVVCYRHVQFPARYRGGLFLLDWTFGRIWFVTLARSGASYSARAELFLESVGDNGFAPTAAAVDPTTGDLYVSIGGRGTRGAVYRIRYPGGVRPVTPADIAALQPRPRSPAWRAEMQESTLSQAESDNALERVRALQSIRRHRDCIAPDQVARVVRADFGHADRQVRRATADLIATMSDDQLRALEIDAHSPAERITLCLGLYREKPAAVVRQATSVLTDRATPGEFRLDAARLLQLAAGDLISRSKRGTVWAGYSPRATAIDREWSNAIIAAVRQVFPAGQDDLDRECSRLLAMLEAEDPVFVDRVVARLTPDSDPVEDFHYLIVLARLRGPRSATTTTRTAGTLLGLDAKLTRRHQNRDTSWPLRLAELYEGLTSRDPGLPAALIAHADFGRPEHARFALAAGFDRRRAAEFFLNRVLRDEEYAWNPALVELIGGLDDERAVSALRQLLGRAGLDGAILPILARHPQAADRERYLEGLNSPQPATVRVCLEALEKLSGTYDGPGVLVLIRALGRLSDAPEQKPLRERLAGHLRQVTGQQIAGVDRAVWEKWFARAYPTLASRLVGPDGVDVRAWSERLARVNWDAGDVGRGQRVFVQTSCASCHSGANALGPDLAGVAGRFSRDDLFTAIVQPSRDVSPRYRATVLTTDDGKVYQGLIVYDAPDGVILQTAPGTTVRVAGSQINSRRISDISLMPAGLLDKVADRDLADLYAYLRRQGTPAKP
jgi:putative membrane-bound dehydrogenase-like protein